MAGHYLEIVSTPTVRAAQLHYYGGSQNIPPQPGRDALGEDEVNFIAGRDSFYLATVTSNGWPYIQHRGGPAGFLRVLDAHTLGFADLRGNRQLISTGNLAANDRASIFLMDYSRRQRLKILAQARTVDARDDRALADQLTPSPALRGKIERLFLIDVISFDWNCPQYIAPRFTEEEIRAAVAPLHQRIAALEAQLQKQK